MTTQRMIGWILLLTVFLIACMPWLANADTGQDPQGFKTVNEWGDVFLGAWVASVLFCGLLWRDAKRYEADSEQRWIIDKGREGITNMRPINFEASNKVYTAPEGSENVDDLHVNLDTREDGHPSIMSVWALDPEEMKAIGEGRGLVLLEIMGTQHPVVGLRVVERDTEWGEKS